MATQAYLAVDLGAESGRVISGLFDGGRLELKQRHRFANGPVPMAGSLRWNVLELWSQILDGLAAAASEDGDRVVSLGVDTWGVDYGLLSSTDELLGQPFHYRDARTQGLLNHTLSRVGRDQIFAQTGLQFMEINTLYQLVATQQQKPELLDAAARFLLMPDLFHWLLSGSRVVEFTNATTTQCFNAVERTWAFDLLEQLEIPTRLFGEVVTPGTRLGSIREDVARRTGLARVPVVTPATHDTASAVAAVPTDQTGKANWAYISSGTWSLMGVEVANAIVTPAALNYNVTNEGGIDGTYRLLKNIMGLWLVQQCRRSFVRDGHDWDYGQLTELAAQARPFTAFVDPDDTAFLSPEDMPAAIREWCRASGQSEPDTPASVVRCALESLALKYARVRDWLQDLTGQAIEVVHIVGGGSQNRLLNQLTADACGCPVVAGPVEATAMGNVLVQARAAGEIGSLGEIRQVVRNSSEIEHFEPQQAEAWKSARERFATLCDTAG